MIQRKEVIKMKKAKLSFRLLNSEIGNDRVLVLKLYEKYLSFRLLNSEIGNDHKRKTKHK